MQKLISMSVLVKRCEPFIFKEQTLGFPVGHDFLEIDASS